MTGLKEKIHSLLDSKIEQKLFRLNRFNHGLSKVLGHDVASPLTVIAGHAERLLKKSTDPVVIASAEKILSGVKNQREIIDSAREYIYVEQRRKEIQITPINDYDLIDAVLPMFEEQLSATKSKIDVVKPDETSLPIYCDPYIIMERVLSPIINNAIKFSADESLISIEIVRSEKNISFVFKNPCEQLAPVQIEEAFSLHHQQKGVGVRKEVGRGYSLAVAEAHVNLVEGSLTIDWVDGKTIVTLNLKKA